jgi:hypothetical protein
LALWLGFQFFSPGFFVVDNNADYFLGSYAHNYRSLIHDHSLPLLNYHQFLGSSHHGQGQTGVLYPPVYGAFFLAELFSFGLGGGIEIIFLFHLVVGVLGMVYLLNQHQVSYTDALLAGFVFLSTPFVFGVSRSWIIVVYLAAYVPWQFGLINQWMKSKFKWSLVGLILIRVLLVLQGYIQWIVLAGIFEVFYYLLNKNKWNTASVATYIASWIITGLLSAPVLLPVWQTAQNSVSRSTQLSTTEILTYAVDVQEWLETQVFIFSDEVVFSGSNYIYYLGLPLLGGFIVLILRQRKSFQESFVWSYVLLSLFGLFISSPLFKTISWLPVLNLFRWPLKHLLFVNFFVIVSVVVGLKRTQPKLLKFILVISLLINLGIVWRYRSTEFAFSARQITPDSRMSWQDELLDLKEGRWITFGVDPDNGGDRFIDTAAYTTASLAGIFHFGGYDALESTNVWQTTRGIPAFGAPNSEFDTASVEYLRSWAVRYWVTPNKAAAEVLAQEFEMEHIFENDSVVILEDSKALPLAFYESDNQPISSVYKPNSIEVTPKHSGRVIFNVIDWTENYRVYSGGRHLIVEDWNNRPSVIIAEPNQLVELVYRDQNFEVGLVLSGIGLICLIVLIKSVYARNS